MNTKKISLLIIFTLFNLCYSQSIKEINDFCDLVSDFYGQPREILPAIIRVESDYMQNTMSSKNAFGLMQVTRGTYDDYCRILKTPKVKSFDCVKYNWKDNIRVGAWYLYVYLIQIEKLSMKEAITCFYWGKNNLNTKSTDVYFNKVQGRMK